MMTTSKFMQTYLSIIKESTEESKLQEPVETSTKTDETPGESTNELKQICFKTSDKNLIDAINSGFEEVVFFVKAKGDDGEDTITEVKFKEDSFGEFTISDIPAESDAAVKDGETVTEDKTCPTCGKDPCECKECPTCGKNPCECK